MERWLSGLKRLPAKQEPGKTGHEGSNPSLSAIIVAPVAQLDRASDYGSEG
jgi:hypothetical protein